MKSLAAWMLLFVPAWAAGSPVVESQVAAAAILALQADQPILPDDFGAPQWSYSGISEPLEIPQEQTEPPQIYLISEPWCGLCPAAARNLSAAGISYKKVSIAEAKRLRLPFAQVQRGGKWTITENVPQVTYPGAQTAMLGLHNASQYRSYASKRPGVSRDTGSRVRMGRDEIDAWVRANYTRSTPLGATVSPVSNVWYHLTDGNPNHTFTSEQVNGLEQWVALALHAEIHKTNPRITPFRPATTKTQQAPPTASADVTGDDLRLIVASLSQALESPSEASQGVVQSIPVDVDDSLLRMLEMLQSDAGKPSGGLTVWFGDKEQKVEFSPPLKVRFERIVEVNAQVRWLKCRGRQVTFGLSGTILNELTIRLK